MDRGNNTGLEIKHKESEGKIGEQWCEGRGDIIFVSRATWFSIVPNDLRVSTERELNRKGK